MKKKHEEFENFEEYSKRVFNKKNQKNKNEKHSKLYKTSLLIFSSYLVIFASILLFNIYKTMILYEENLVENFIIDYIESDDLIKDLDAKMFKVSKLENTKDSITKGIKTRLETSNYNIVKDDLKSNDDFYYYYIKVDNEDFMSLKINKENSYQKLGIFTVDEWKIDKVESFFDDGIFSYNITIPSKYKLYVNNHLVKENYIISSYKNEELMRLDKYIDIKNKVVYKIDNLIYEPKIVIKNENDEEVEFEIKKNIIVENEQKRISYEEMKKRMKLPIDILSFAKKWSLYLTDDLDGRFNSIKEYLVQDSYMYEMAKGWATNRDITFVSNHRLKPETFTNESVENCIIYNDGVFSCEVSLTKNMIVSGKPKIDTMHDRLYFMFYDGSYKIMDMKSL